MLRTHADKNYRKMHVPTDAFGGKTPEQKAGQALVNLFTMTAVRVILAQVRGYRIQLNITRGDK